METSVPTNVESPSEEMELVERAKTDEAAFGVLYNRYFPKIYGYIFKRLGNREAAEDVVSTIFLKAFCNLKKYQPQACGFSAWLYKVAGNCLIDYYRQTGRRPATTPLDETFELADGEPNPMLLAQSAEERVIVKKVLAALPERYQKVLDLKFFGEFSNLEIAEILETSTNNTGVLVYRALKEFAKIYKKYVQ